MQWPQALPWAGEGAIIRYVSFLIICTLLVYVGSWWGRISPLLVGATVALGIALLAGALWPLVVALWFAISSALTGKFFLSVLFIKREDDNWLTNFLIGAGIYGTAVGLLAHFPVNYSGVYGSALALPLILGWRVVRDETKNIFALMVGNSLNGLSIQKLDVAIAVVALVYFIVALMPEVGYDALVMHLFIPAHLSLRHQWGFDASTYVWAVMPMLGDWLFAIGYMLAGETAARIINVGFIFILGWLVRNIVLWAGGSSISARWAVLIFLSTPLTFTEGSTLFIESVWAAFVVAGILAILSSCSKSGNPNFELPVAGLFLGCALATKAVTFMMLPILLILLIWRFRVWFKQSVLPFMAFGLCLFLVIGIIPYMTAWQLTGNPVFPFFNHIFHSPLYATGKDPFGAAVFNEGIKWNFFYQATFQSGKYLEATNGVVGFQWLLLFIPATVLLLAIRHKKALALLIIGCVSIVLIFNSTSYLRYIFPALVLLTAFIGISLDKNNIKNIFLQNISFILIIITLGINLVFFVSGSFYRNFSLRSALVDGSTRELYLSEQLPIHAAVKLINNLNLQRTPVAIFTSPLAAGLSADALYPNWYNFKFQAEISSISSGQDLANILLRRGVTFIILDSNWDVKKYSMYENVSEKIAEYGSISVRKLKIDYRYNTELLSNSDFKSLQGWALAPDVKYDADTGIVVVNVASSATQAVAVSPGLSYINTVVARCDKEKTLGRIQINWFDSKTQFVSTNIKTFECSKIWAEHSMKVIVPSKVVTAIVYTTGHTSTPLVFKRNSLRQ
ncbi:Dolichyl-phosphate-mannose-protein mannosyltransferase [Betaproteobacteria bacterium MOLA814]|nr:Dolichyl-phosphate-mannose-protein mannosyltransferase [Betaproteobacteria bacterium MOLA814]